MRRRIGPGAGFLFRGDGFYATDYRSKTYKEKAKSESGAGTSGTGKDAGAAADASAPAPNDTSASSAQPAADKPPKKPPQT